MRGRAPLVVALMACLLATGCIVLFREVPIKRVDPAAASPTSTGTVFVGNARAHLRDGSTVLFRDSVLITPTALVGVGAEYALMQQSSRERTRVPLDSVVALETFEQKDSPLLSFVVSTALTGIGAGALLLTAKALFGSCPTIYTDDGTGPVLQAEGFSYAIAARFEHPDLDPINIVPDANGILQFELRNEALETHYINRLALQAVRHVPGSLALPSQHQRAVIVSDLRAVRAIDRSGRDVSATLAARDESFYATPRERLDAVSEQDFDDWIDITVGDAAVSGAAGADSIALVVRFRNSLLNTVLLYEGMLSSGNATSWLTEGLEQNATAGRLSAWYGSTMGLRVEVGTADARRVLARIGDVGPIAFRDVAIVLPRSAIDAAGRVRLRFAADNWRIDQIRAARYDGPAAVETLRERQVLVRSSESTMQRTSEPAAAQAIATADSSYLQTLPGQRLWVSFDAPTAQRGEEISYLIAWQGWYREWMRGEWLAQSATAPPFEPGARTLVAAMRKWSAGQAEFERVFYATKIPVR